MAIHKLAVIIKNPSNEDECLLVRQSPPPKFGDQEYDSYVDSDLWDLPSAPLDSLEGEFQSGIVVEGAESILGKLDLRKFGIDSSLNKVLEQVGVPAYDFGNWELWKFVEEAEFGPGPPVNTVYILGKMIRNGRNLQEHCKWMTVESCMNWLLEVKPSSERVGPLVVLGLLNDAKQPAKWKLSPIPRCQEYPPGVTLVPMGSRTGKPFHTTNLVVFAPESVPNDHSDGSFVSQGDALVVDPGCRSQFHEELREIIAALPRKLVVFVTHHHIDHVDGLSVIQKCNPDATLLAHENTMRRIGKGDWSLGYTSVSGGEDICIGGQCLKVIFAPGHTDGHTALLHVSTHSLIVGDHCVGQGSAVLDINSGGNMSEYFQTTYNFLELSPHVLIPMHGRVNLWPKHMLCQYLKNRRKREASILKTIENGAKTLFEIVSITYPDVDRTLWIPAASNVRLHVDHLAQHNKLPMGFPFQKFQKTCGLHFLIRWLRAYVSSNVHLAYSKLWTVKGVSAVAVAAAGFAALFVNRNKLSSK